MYTSLYLFTHLQKGYLIGFLFSHVCLNISWKGDCKMSESENNHSEKLDENLDENLDDLHLTVNVGLE